MTKEKQYIAKKKKGLYDFFYPLLSEVGKRNVNEDNILNYFINHDACKNCGECCNHIPCIFSPNDFIDINDLDYMKGIMEIGLIRVSSVKDNSNNNIYVLGPCGQLDTYSYFNPMIDSNPCILKDYNGCMLSDEFRPTGAILLYPSKPIMNRCVCFYKTENIIDDYKPYQNTLETLKYKYDKICKTSATEEEVKTLTRKIAGYKK